MSLGVALESTPALHAKGVAVGLMGRDVLIGTNGDRGKFAVMRIDEAKELAHLLAEAIVHAELDRMAEDAAKQAPAARLPLFEHDLEEGR